MATIQVKPTFEVATDSNAAELTALHNAAAAELTRQFGQGPWTSTQTERGVLNQFRRPTFERVFVARRFIGRNESRIAGTLRLATKKPWAIDTAYFAAAKKPLYLTSMAVHPDFQRQGVGRFLMHEAAAIARAWPADAIRLDAWDAAAGAGPFYAKCGYREVARVTYKRAPLVYFELVLPPMI